MVYVEVEEGDDFGQIDIITSSMEQGQYIYEVLKYTEGLVR